MVVYDYAAAQGHDVSCSKYCLGSIQVLVEGRRQKTPEYRTQQCSCACHSRSDK